MDEELACGQVVSQAGSNKNSRLPTTMKETPLKRKDLVENFPTKFTHGALKDHFEREYVRVVGHAPQKQHINSLISSFQLVWKVLRNKKSFFSAPRGKDWLEKRLLTKNLSSSSPTAVTKTQSPDVRIRMSTLTEQTSALAEQTSASPEQTSASPAQTPSVDVPTPEALQTASVADRASRRAAKSPHVAARRTAVPAKTTVSTMKSAEATSLMVRAAAVAAPKTVTAVTGLMAKPTAEVALSSMESQTLTVAAGTPNVAAGTPTVVAGTPTVVAGTQTAAAGKPTVAAVPPTVAAGTPTAAARTPDEMADNEPALDAWTSTVTAGSSVMDDQASAAMCRTPAVVVSPTSTARTPALAARIHAEEARKVAIAALRAFEDKFPYYNTTDGGPGYLLF